MSAFTKLDQIRRHLRLAPSRNRTVDNAKRVQKNLSILEQDAQRLTMLAKRDGLSQARLLTAALDAYDSRQASDD